MVVELITGATLPACVFCGQPDADDTWTAEDFPQPVACCADEEACCERRMRELARAEDTRDGWVCIGTSWIEQLPDQHTGRRQPSPITPAIAAAWSEAW